MWYTYEDKNSEGEYFAKNWNESTNKVEKLELKSFNF